MAAAMTGSPYDAPLSALRDGVEDLAIALFIWGDRDDANPQPMARRKASDAVAAVDAMLLGLHDIRARLVAEVRESDDAAAVRADAVLDAARHARDTGHG